MKVINETKMKLPSPDGGRFKKWIVQDGKPVQVPNPVGPWFAQSIARIFIHELGHCMGIKHTRDGHCSTMERSYSDWIKETFTDEYTPQVQEPKEKPKQDLQMKRYRAALVNLKRATTRLKRATTITKKWRQKVQYYERAMAAKEEKK